jgi:S1-C subfamily serine protease
VSEESPRRRPPLLAAVLLSASVGLVGGASAAWAIYRSLGPAERVVSAPVVAPGGGGNTAPSTTTYASIAQAAAPSLVTVVTHPVAAGDLASGSASFGSGFVASGDGLVVTSARALAGATRLRLAYADGEVIDASVAGTDAVHGIVVLRAAQAPQSKPAPLSFADFTQHAARPGDLVIAVGMRALSGLSVTPGTVTATGCAVQPSSPAGSGVGSLGAMRVSATAAPEDDGAPLLDAGGQVVGVVTDDGGAGLVALDGRSAAELVAALARGDTGARPSFGVQSCLLDASHAGAVGAKPGALVVAVTPGGAGEAAGLRIGDVVTAVNSTTIDADHPLDPTALAISSGQLVQLTVVRDGQEQTVALTVT